MFLFQCKMQGMCSVLRLLLLCCCLCCSVTGFVIEEFTLCSFGDDKGGNVTFNYVMVFNRQPIVQYDTTYKEFEPMSGMIPKLYAVAVNICDNLTNPRMVDYMQEKERTCKKDVQEYWESTERRTVKPSMKVFLPESIGTETPNSLVCHVWGFYPSDISVSWVKNNEIVISNTSEAVPVGDWTYQVVARQDVRDSSPDDEYTCVVQHPSTDHLMMMSWKQGLTSSQIVKFSISSIIFALGLIASVSGFVIWRWFNRSGYILIQGYNDGD
uniref:Ig-like domain-containing protein n=1 Tax=Leptobrachium leishanense TaxID=445787 RepID=A0A8C5Q9F2_9ANUR